MKAIKVLYRDPDGDLHSAIPTPYALAYAEGEKTVPEIGRLMVFLDAEKAKGFCEKDAVGWYPKHSSQCGELETWAVECRNLYKLRYLIPPCELTTYGECGQSHLVRFWQIVARGDSPRIYIRWAVMAGTPMWTTDWIIPQERLGIYSIRRKMWVHWRKGWRRAR